MVSANFHGARAGKGDAELHSCAPPTLMPNLLRMCFRFRSPLATECSSSADTVEMHSVAASCPSPGSPQQSNCSSEQPVGSCNATAASSQNPQAATVQYPVLAIPSWRRDVSPRIDPAWRTRQLRQRARKSTDLITSSSAEQHTCKNEKTNLTNATGWPLQPAAAQSTATVLGQQRLRRRAPSCWPSRRGLASSMSPRMSDVARQSSRGGNAHVQSRAPRGFKARVRWFQLQDSQQQSHPSDSRHLKPRGHFWLCTRSRPVFRVAVDATPEEHGFDRTGVFRRCLQPTLDVLRKRRADVYRAHTECSSTRSGAQSKGSRGWFNVLRCSVERGRRLCAGPKRLGLSLSKLNKNEECHKVGAEQSSEAAAYDSNADEAEAVRTVATSTCPHRLAIRSKPFWQWQEEHTGRSQQRKASTLTIVRS